MNEGIWSLLIAMLIMHFFFLLCVGFKFVGGLYLLVAIVHIQMLSISSHSLSSLCRRSRTFNRIHKYLCLFKC